MNKEKIESAAENAKAHVDMVLKNIKDHADEFLRADNCTGDADYGNACVFEFGNCFDSLESGRISFRISICAESVDNAKTT